MLGKPLEHRKPNSWLPHFLQEWITLRDLRRSVADVNAEFVPKFAALAGKRGDSYDSLCQDHQYMASEFAGEICSIETERLLRKAEKYDVSTDELPEPKLMDSHWENDDWGRRYLTREAECQVRNLIRKARRERHI